MTVADRTRVYRTPAGERAVIEAYEALLSSTGLKSPVPFTRLTVSTRSGPTAVFALGPRDAPPIVALHGSGSNTGIWLPQLAAWARDFRVYGVDVVGEPGLSAPTRPALGTGEAAAWLDDVLAGLDLPAAAFVGMSLGGWLALDYAIRRPTAVSRLALLAPSGIGRRKAGVLLVALALRPFGRWGLRRTLSYALGTRSPVHEGLSTLIFTHFRPRMEPIPRFTDAQLSALPMPVTAVMGGRDAMLDSAGTAARLRAALPHARVTVLPDAGHLLPAASYRQILAS